MTVMLEQGSLAYRIFDKCDRWVCFQIWGERIWVSTKLGNLLISGNALWYHEIAASFVDLFTFEYGHCWKNAGKA